MKLHTRLRTARKNQGLTIMQVEKLSGKKIAACQINIIERGVQRKPKTQSLRALSTALKIPYIELLLLSGHVTKQDLKECQ